MAGPANFLDLPAELSDPATARTVVLPVPYEATTTYGRGTAAGPSAIVAASAQVEWFDEELGAEVVRAGVATLPPVEPAATPEEQMARIRAAAAPVLEDGRLLLSLGGEHTITVALVAAAAEAHPGLSVLQIDAHADLREAYQGSRLSHACVMRRVLEITPRIAQVGVRSYSREEREQCPRQAGRFITPRRVREDPGWVEAALELLGETVYVTVDVDGLDPSEAPGVGTPEPGGLHWGEATALLRRVAAERRVVAADVVEVRPIPPSNVTEFLAARLACKIIAYTQA